MKQRTQCATLITIVFTINMANVIEMFFRSCYLSLVFLAEKSEVRSKDSDSLPVAALTKEQLQQAMLYLIKVSMEP